MDTTLTHIPSPWERPENGRLRDPGAIENYDLLAFIKSGGFGDVWLARESVTGVRRVIKVVYKSEPERAARDLAGVRRYQRSAHNHPHLLQILSVGQNERCYFCVMEAADNALADPKYGPATKVAAGASPAGEGEAPTEPDSADGGSAADRAPMAHPDPPREYEPVTLRTLLHAKGRLDGRAALELLRKLVAGVARLHHEGLAHHDLKPENILIVHGEPKIADAGLVAPLDEPPPRSGTPTYMTPEGRPDDVYALGRILYELISGRPSSDFPSLPAELLKTATPALTATVTILNRACHPQSNRRFGHVDEMEAAIARAVRKSRDRWWLRRRLSGRGKVTAAVCAVVALALATLVGYKVYGHFVPLELWEQQIDLRTLPALAKAAQRVPGEAPLYPLLRVDSQALSAGGDYAYGLERPVENFVLDAHVRFIRPWGSVQLGVAEQPTGRVGACVAMMAQPDGLGPRVELTGVDDAGLLQRESDPILGHPLPGVEYVVRLARCRDGLTLALWPLGERSTTPFVRSIKPRKPDLRPRHATISGLSHDPQAAADLLEVSVRAYSAPLKTVDAEPFRPAPVHGQVVPAFVPALPATKPALGGNLLAAPFHPYDSAAWLSVGSWSWWESDQPYNLPKPIRCTPFSRQERKNHEKDAPYSGFQMLRFDRAVFNDFTASVKIRLADWNNPKNYQDYDPFLGTSSSGGVGMAFQLQDDSAPGCAWGAGYVVEIGVSPADENLPYVSLARYDGFLLARDPQSRYGFVCGTPDAHIVRRWDDICPRAELFARDGFVLTVRRCGPQIDVFVNGRPVLPAPAEDPRPLGPGRIALFDRRLIATFESLEVTPLPPEK